MLNLLYFQNMSLLTELPFPLRLHDPINQFNGL
jgi:hypothetical protein